MDKRLDFGIDVWVGTTRLYVSFERLFLVQEKKSQVLGFMGFGNETYWFGALGGYTIFLSRKKSSLRL